MAMYHVVKPLSGRGRINQGELTRLEWLTPDKVDILVRIGAVARVKPPLLADLPGWEGRAAGLAGMGIINGEQFVEAACDGFAALVAGMGADEVEVRQWHGELIALMSKNKKRGCGCRPE